MDAPAGPEFDEIVFPDETEWVKVRARPGMPSGCTQQKCSCCGWQRRRSRLFPQTTALASACVWHHTHTCCAHVRMFTLCVCTARLPACLQPDKAPPRVYKLQYKEEPDRDVWFW